MDPASNFCSDSRDEQEESNFNRLFKDILNKIINMKAVPESDIEEAIGKMTDGFNTFSFPDMTKWENLCGYLFRFATHGAGLTRNRVLEAARNFKALESCLKRKDLRIISLGGGPGNDIMGFCSALFECVGKGPSPNLNITVVDRYEEWSICVTLLKKLVTEENFGNVSDLFRSNNVNMSFLKVELPGNPMRNVSYIQHLQKADVILMVKLISILDLNEVERLMENLYKNMQNKALLLSIDSPPMRKPKPLKDKVKKYFDFLFESKLEDYRASCEISERFNSNDYVVSKAQIAVLRKRSPSSLKEEEKGESSSKEKEKGESPSKEEEKGESSSKEKEKGEYPSKEKEKEESPSKEKEKEEPPSKRMRIE